MGKPTLEQQSIMSHPALSPRHATSHPVPSQLIFLSSSIFFYRLPLDFVFAICFDIFFVVWRLAAIRCRACSCTKIALTHSLSRSLSHTHTHTHSLSLTHSLSHTHTRSHTHSLSLSLTHSLSLSRSLSRVPMGTDAGRAAARK